MKKKILSICSALLIATALINPINAKAEKVRLIDDASLLTESESDYVVDRLDEVSYKHNIDVVVVTKDSLGGADIMDYADDYFDYNGYSNNGIIYVIDMGSRGYWFSTKGSAIIAINDDGIDYLKDQCVSYLSDGNYEDSFLTFADSVDWLYDKYETGEPYVYTSAPIPITTILGIALLIGIIFSCIPMGALKRQIKNVSLKGQANDYVKDGSFELRAERDIYLYRHISKRERPQQTSSSGHSSTHTSSSGSSHGGGGGHF